eukprot:GHVU01179641.1.p1 GENE.GHVU01179641.1~~GHVU01179641.1.p1  ORF type:complete len:708 (-),score=11.36 GHVU01179641.1:76-2199(-)
MLCFGFIQDRRKHQCSIVLDQVGVSTSVTSKPARPQDYSCWIMQVMSLCGIFPLVTIGTIPLVIVAWKRNKLDLIPKNWKMYYNGTAISISPVDRPIYVEGLKVFLLFCSIIALSGAVPKHIPLTIWCMYDIAVLVQLILAVIPCCQRIRHFVENCEKRSLGTTFYLMLYTYTIGIGYGTALKLTFMIGPEHTGSMIITLTKLFICNLSVISIGVICYFGWKNRKYPAMFGPAMIMLIAVCSNLTCFALSYVLGPFWDCPAVLLLNVDINILLVCLVVYVEGSVMRNLPELVHMWSIMFFLSVYTFTPEPTYMSTVTMTDACVTTLYVLLSVNLGLVLVYDGFLYGAGCEWRHGVSRSRAVRADSIQSSDIPQRTHNQNVLYAGQLPFRTTTLLTEVTAMEKNEVEPVGPVVTDFAGNAVECSICYEKIREDSNISMLDNCGHHFHTVCITKALQQTGNRCPLCRKDYTQENITKLTSPKMLAQTFNRRWEKVLKQFTGEAFKSSRPSQPVPHISQLFSSVYTVEDIDEMGVEDIQDMGVEEIMPEEASVLDNHQEPIYINRAYNPTSDDTSQCNTDHRPTNHTISTESRRTCLECSRPFQFRDGMVVVTMCFSCGGPIHPYCRRQCRHVNNAVTTALCPVCEEPLSSQDVSILAMVRRCHHVFHMHCIKNHINTHHECPVCQSEINDHICDIKSIFRYGHQHEARY